MLVKLNQAKDKSKTPLDPFEGNKCCSKQEAHFSWKKNTHPVCGDIPGTHPSPRGQSDCKLTLSILRKNLNLKNYNGISTKSCRDMHKHPHLHFLGVAKQLRVAASLSEASSRRPAGENTLESPGSNSDKQARRQTAWRQSRQETRTGSADTASDPWPHQSSGKLNCPGGSVAWVRSWTIPVRTTQLGGTRIRGRQWGMSSKMETDSREPVTLFTPWAEKGLHITHQRDVEKRSPQCCSKWGNQPRWVNCVPRYSQIPLRYEGEWQLHTHKWISQIQRWVKEARQQNIYSITPFI